MIVCMKFNINKYTLYSLVGENKLACNVIMQHLTLCAVSLRPGYRVLIMCIVDPVSENECAALCIVLCLVAVCIEGVSIYRKMYTSSPPHVTYLLNKPKFFSFTVRFEMVGELTKMRH